MDTPFKRAKRLRRDMSPTEREVWSVLRGRGLGGWKFRRQVPVGPYIVDFLCVEKNLALELDGHSHDLREAHDGRRDAYLRRLGYRIVRLSNGDVEKDLDGAMRYLLAILNDDPLT